MQLREARDDAVATTDTTIGNPFEHLHHPAELLRPRGDLPRAECSAGRPRPEALLETGALVLCSLKTREDEVARGAPVDRIEEPTDARVAAGDVRGDPRVACFEF